MNDIKIQEGKVTHPKFFIKFLGNKILIFLSKCLSEGQLTSKKLLIHLIGERQINSFMPPENQIRDYLYIMQ